MRQYSYSHFIKKLKHQEDITDESLPGFEPWFTMILQLDKLSRRDATSRNEEEWKGEGVDRKF
jgi:hypothetical protein